MNKVNQILSLCVFFGIMAYVTGNTFQEGKNTFQNRKIYHNTSSQKITISAISLSDTLFTGAFSVHHINLTNKTSRIVSCFFSGDFIKPKKIQNYAVQYDSTTEYINCGDLGFGKNVQAITVEMWYKPFDFTNECDGYCL